MITEVKYVECAGQRCLRLAVRCAVDDVILLRLMKTGSAIIVSLQYLTLGISRSIVISQHVCNAFSYCLDYRCSHCLCGLSLAGGEGRAEQGRSGTGDSVNVLCELPSPWNGDRPVRNNCVTSEYLTKLLMFYVELQEIHGCMLLQWHVHESVVILMLTCKLSIISIQFCRCACLVRVPYGLLWLFVIWLACLEPLSRAVFFSYCEQPGEPWLETGAREHNVPSLPCNSTKALYDLGNYFQLLGGVDMRWTPDAKRRILGTDEDLQVSSDCYAS